MNRKTNHFGFGQSGRPSGIRPPSSGYGQSGQNRSRLGSSSSVSSVPSIPSSTSSRKANNGFNFPGSGGSRTSRLSNGIGNGGARQSVFGNLRSNPFSSARKSATAKLAFGLTPQHNRQSFQPNSMSSAQSNRRSSIGGNRHVTDSRPLSDSQYQRQCVTKLIAFLTDNPIAVYPHPISKTLATRPTVSDISKIFEFLFLCFGIKSKVSPMDVEIPKTMIAIEYPFPVKKSDLVSFTSGRALGSVLGMLEWLVDSLTYSVNMDPIRTFYPNFEGEVDIKTELIKLNLRTHAEVLRDELDPNHIDIQLQQLITKTYGTEDDFEAMVDEQEVLEQEVKRLDEEIQHTKDLPDSIANYKSDIKNYEQYMSEMKAHNKSNEEILENLEKESEEKLATIKKVKEQMRQLKIVVEEQAFGIEEAVLAKERKQQLEDEIKQEFSVIDDLKKSIRVSRLECSKFENEIKKMHSDLDSFITAMTDLVDSPVMSNYSSTLRELLSNKEWLQILDELKNINGESNGTNINDLNKLLSNRVHSLKIAIVQQLSSLQGCVTLAETQKLSELKLLIEEKEKQLKQNEKKISKLTTELETMRKDQVSQIAALQSDCDRTRQMLSELDGNTKRSQKEEKQNLLELRKQVKEKENFVKTEKESMINELKETIDNNKSQMQEFDRHLDKSIAAEQTKTIHLKNIAVKYLSETNNNVGAKKDKKTKEIRDKNHKKKDKRNK